MAEDDIYRNKARYEEFIANIDSLAVPGIKPKKGVGRSISARILLT